MTRRTDRVEDLLRSELSILIQRELGDPRVRLTTVSTVSVSPDLRRAIVRLSVLGDDAQRGESLAALRHARGFLRAGLAKRLRRMKTIPELVFELDRGPEHSQRIENLLEGLHDDLERS